MPNGAVGKIRKGMDMSNPTKMASNKGKVNVTAKPPMKAAVKKTKDNVG